MSALAKRAKEWWWSLHSDVQRMYRAAHFQKFGTYNTDTEIALWARGVDTNMAYIHDAEDMSTTAMKSDQSAKKAARSGIDITGKKMRIVFGKGRDLNIFNVQTMNVDGQWWRITDGDGHLYVIDPKKVNYTETK